MLYFSVKVLTVQREYYTFLPEADIPEDRPISGEAMYDVRSLNKKKYIYTSRVPQSMDIQYSRVNI